MSYIEENISNFDESCKFFEQRLTNEELYGFLRSGSISEKQLACIKIEECSVPQEAQTFMDNLTGVDGKIRETVSFKLKSFIPAHPELFLQNKFFDIFLDAIIDINGNICRNIITTLRSLTKYEHFCDYFVPRVVERSHNVIDTIENFEYKDRKYVTNKENFKLYWYLESLSIFPDIDTTILFPLIKRCIQIEEYTIREKAARLISKLPPESAEKLNGLNFDNNFYVNLALTK